MEAVYLRKKSDLRPIIPKEDLYISTEALMKRDDMEVYVPGKVMSPPPEKPNPAEMTVITSGLPPVTPVTSATPLPAPPQTVGLASEDDGFVKLDPNQITLIKHAIRGLDRTQDFTKETAQRPSMPRVEAIEKAIGRKLLPGEREAAWTEIQAETPSKVPAEV